MSIYDYFTQRLGATPDDESLRELPMVSPCGRDCARVIGAAATLLKAADVAVEDEIRAVAEHAVTVYWRG